MGFWGTLGKIALPALGVAAAPFTGGGSLLTTLGLGAKTAGLIGAGANVAGRLASGASKQRAEDRGVQTDFDLINNANYNRSMQDRTGQQNQQALQYANARTGAEQARMRQLASADMLGSSKPPTDPRTRLSGAGYMSPETIAMMRDRAMKALESGDVPQMTDMPAYRETQMAQPGRADSILNALSMGSTVLGGLNEAGIFNRQPPVDPTQNAANDDRVNDIYGKIRFFGGN